MADRQVKQFLEAAIEASVYVSPADAGLTVVELYEVCTRLGLKRGEISDSIMEVVSVVAGKENQRHLLPDYAWFTPANLAIGQDPELRNPEAFDFVFHQLNDLAKEVGVNSASLSRDILVSRALEKGIRRNDIEVAITLMSLAKQLVFEPNEKAIRFPNHGIRRAPTADMNQAASTMRRQDKSIRTQVMAHVIDVIARRSDGRTKSAEPLEAFAEQLSALNFGHFHLWWTQTVNELRRTDPVSAPLSMLVLSAALVEGVLTFVVKHAQVNELNVFGSNTFLNDPRSWRIDDLVASAARGGDTAILNYYLRSRAERLISMRQRIHAGRMLSEYPRGVPDLRPEEANEARAIANEIVRSVLDWLERYPPPSKI